MIVRRRVLMTPEMAKEILAARNRRNRNLSEYHAASYVEPMRRGDFADTEIAFYADGALADGQHRLRALVLSGEPLWVCLSEGWPMDRVWDRGRGRSVSDTIRTTGIADWVTRRHTGVALCMARMIAGRRARWSDRQVGELCLAWKEPIAFAVDVALAMKRRGVSTAALQASAAAAWYSEAPDDLVRFGLVLQTGVPSGREDVAALRLREWCMAGRRTSGDAGVVSTMLRAQNAIRHFCRRNAVAQLREPAAYIYRDAVPAPAWLLTEDAT